MPLGHSTRWQQHAGLSVKRLAVALSVLATGCASLQPTDDWSSADQKRMLGVYSVLAADAVSAARINQAPPNIVESGFPAKQLFGERPNPEQVIALSIGLAFAYREMAKRLPEPWRKRMQYFVIGTHGYGLSTNCRNDLC